MHGYMNTKPQSNQIIIKQLLMALDELDRRQQALNSIANDNGPDTSLEEAMDASIWALKMSYEKISVVNALRALEVSPLMFRP